MTELRVYHVCDRCGTTAQGAVSTEAGRTPRMGVPPDGWALRWRHESDGKTTTLRGYLAWCPACVEALGVAAYKAAVEIHDEAARVRWQAANVEYQRVLSEIPEPAPAPPDPLIADWRARRAAKEKP